jgi:hypothetical protein
VKGAGWFCGIAIFVSSFYVKHLKKNQIPSIIDERKTNALGCDFFER